jgi:hypothetical protein
MSNKRQLKNTISFDLSSSFSFVPYLASSDPVPKAKPEGKNETALMSESCPVKVCWHLPGKRKKTNQFFSLFLSRALTLLTSVPQLGSRIASSADEHIGSIGGAQRNRHHISTVVRKLLHLNDLEALNQRKARKATTFLSFFSPSDWPQCPKECKSYLRKT